MSQIAKKLGVDQVTINMIFRRRIWTHVTSDLPSVDKITASRRLTKGERNNSAKLTEKDVRYIKKLLADGYQSAEIGRKYGVTRNTILFIKWGRTWTHVV